MATAANRAARNRAARQRLDAALAGISSRLGVEVPPKPRTMKDAGLRPIVEIERFADFAESVLAALDASGASPMPVADAPPDAAGDAAIAAAGRSRRKPQASQP
ncbi:MAG: hypothetical protein KC442_10555 [Thermomicrobiales bacterium]|nr:hypothetical protein [Thermomicrobiales bacterium]